MAFDAGVGDAQHQRARAALLELEVEHAALLLDHGAERQRQQRHVAAPGAGGGHAQDVVAPAQHLDHRQRGTAGAAARLQRDLIAQVVADHRLHQIGQVGEQHAVRQLARRHRAQLLVHRLQDHPVAVHVQLAVAAFPGDGQELRGAVAGAHGGTQRAADQRPRAAAQRFTARDHVVRVDGQRAGLLPLGQQRGRRGVGGDDGRPEGLQLAAQIAQRLLDVEAGRGLAEPAVDAAQPLEADDAGEVPLRGRDQRGALAQAGGGVGVEQAVRRAHAVAHGLQRVVHGQRGRVLHEHARPPAGARAFPGHVALEALAHARQPGGEAAQLVQLERRVGHPVGEALHQLVARDRLHAGEVGRHRRGRQAFAVERRALLRGLQQALQPAGLPLRQQAGRRVAGGDDVERGRLEAQRVEDGRAQARGPGVVPLAAVWGMARLSCKSRLLFDFWHHERRSLVRGELPIIYRSWRAAWPAPLTGINIAAVPHGCQTCG